MKKLRGVDGKSWAFMKRMDINDLHSPEDLYLRRWRIFMTPWFGLFLHKIVRPDNDVLLHDHPWAFVSIILKGGYQEVRQRPRMWMREAKVFTPGKINIFRRGDFHKIIWLRDGGPCWTLVAVGRRASDWGYQLANGTFIDHQSYWRSENPSYRK